jgi:predicted transcriptional regulator YheO
MKTNETLKLKALQLKAQLDNEFGSDLVDSLVASNPEMATKAMRNICAFISPDLFEQIETLCTNLSLSKRQVVEMALIDFMEKANQIMQEVNPFEHIDLQSAREAEGE